MVTRRRQSWRTAGGSRINPGKPHGILPLAVTDLVAGGMSPADALATATSVAATACGLSDHKGHIRAGYDAGLARPLSPSGAATE